MKKSFVLISLLALLQFVSIAGESKHTYSFSDPVICKTGSYQLIGFTGALQTGLPGEPALPYCKVSLLLPPGETATRIEYKWLDEVIIPGTFVLFPQQQVRPVSDEPSGTFLKKDEVYALNTKYPAEPSGKIITSYLNGRSFAFASFTPVRYNPSTGEASYFKQVEVTVYSSPSQQSMNALKNLRTSREVDDQVGRFADNPSAASAYTTDKAAATGGYQMLIITTNAFSAAFDELIAHYLQEGIVCEVITTEEINASGTGNDLQEKIRNYIIDEYQQNGIEHVLLGGDDELVPHRGFYCSVQSGSGYSDQNIPADLYYSALDGNWNTDGDALWGEPGEDDLLPDISVGRMPFSNLSELNAMINKSISYQFTPVMGEMKNVIMAGENLYSSPLTNGSQYLELLIGTHSDNDYTTSGIPENYNFDKMYDEISYWSGSDLISHLSQGNPMLNHSGHANETYVMKLSNSDITNANFSQVNGTTHNFVLVYTHGCLCGAFDYSDCIAEKMVTINNFAACFVGNSRYGWFNEGQTEGPSAHLHREFIDALYTDKYLRVGRAHMESKIETMPWVTAPGQWEPGALRWCFYDCNVLGDPAMAVWTDNPFVAEVSYSQAIPVGSASTTVTVHQNGQPATGVACVIVKNGQIVGKSETNSSGIAFITFEPAVVETGDAFLYVSGNNCKPAAYELEFIPAAGPYIVYQSVIVNDATGNQDGIPDFGETVSLSLTLQNNGVADATNVTVTLSSDDPYVTITDSTEQYPSIPSNSWVTINDGFTVKVSSDIPDMHEIVFNVTATSETSWYSTFPLVAHAPQLVLGNMTLNNESIESNGRLDPGETAIMNIPISNEGHSNCLDMTATLASSSSWISITNPVNLLGSLPAGGNANAAFDISVDATIPLYTLVGLSFAAATGELQINQEYYQLIGAFVEDFETGDFTQYQWEQGQHPWTINGGSPFEGNYSARSGVIYNNDSSQLSIAMEVLGADSISFYSKVSSEETFDRLQFFINQQLKGEWAGEIPWQRHSFAVEAGLNTFKWMYMKDFYNFQGSDCAWIDYIVFPAFRNTTGIDGNEAVAVDFSLYPNPANRELRVKLNMPHSSNCRISIIAADGKLCHTEKLQANNETVIDISGFKSGYYQCLVTDGQTTVGRALIIR